MAERIRGLYLVTPDAADSATLLASVERVLPARPALLQYRNKLADPLRQLDEARSLRQLCSSAGVPLIINDDVALARAVAADGVHLGRDDGSPAAARAVLGADALIGVSCYDEWTRAEDAAAAGADYVAFGAMFPSSTKPGAVRAPLTLLTRARAALDCPVAAIGGITLDNAPALIEVGADLLAVISDVFAAADPLQRALAYSALFA